MKSTEIIHLMENQNGYEEQYELEANGIDYKIRLAHIINRKTYEFLSAGSLSSHRNSNSRIQHTFPMLKLLNATLNDNQERNKNWRTKNR